MMDDSLTQNKSFLHIVRTSSWSCKKLFCMDVNPSQQQVLKSFFSLISFEYGL